MALRSRAATPFPNAPGLRAAGPGIAGQPHQTRQGSHRLAFIELVLVGTHELDRRLPGRDLEKLRVGRDARERGNASDRARRVLQHVRQLMLSLKMIPEYAHD